MNSSISTQIPIVRAEDNRKAYTAPRLIVHGDVQELTKGNALAGTDGLTQST